LHIFSFRTSPGPPSTPLSGPKRFGFFDLFFPSNESGAKRDLDFEKELGIPCWATLAAKLRYASLLGLEFCPTRKSNGSCLLLSVFSYAFFSCFLCLHRAIGLTYSSPTSRIFFFTASLLRFFHNFFIFFVEESPFLPDYCPLVYYPRQMFYAFSCPPALFLLLFFVFF